MFEQWIFSGSSADGCPLYPISFSLVGGTHSSTFEFKDFKQPKEEVQNLLVSYLYLVIFTIFKFFFPKTSTWNNLQCTSLGLMLKSLLFFKKICKFHRIGFLVKNLHSSKKIP
jgi:hypothetical protein